jgi:hypothetical protein
LAKPGLFPTQLLETNFAIDHTHLPHRRHLPECSKRSSTQLSVANSSGLPESASVTSLFV